MTQILQPTDLHLISNLKKLNINGLFQKCFEITNDTDLTLRVFGKAISIS